MKTTRLNGLIITLLAIVVSACSQPKSALHLFVWSEYVDPQLISDFEQQFDCKVTIDLYEDPDSMIAKLAAGGAGLYDIVVPSDTTLPLLVKRGLLAPLRAVNIPNLRHLDGPFQKPPYDPSGQYGAPCQWGTVGLLMRTGKGPAPADSWGLLFDPAQQPGPFLLLEDVRATIGAALRYKGYSVNSTNPTELGQARDLLVEAKRRSLGFEGVAGCKNRVLSGGAVLAMAYNGDGLRAAREDPETRFFVPREGTQIWVDVFSIPAKAPHRELAEKFINYMLDPKVSARFSSFNRLATPNRAAREFIDPADLQNPAMYPSAEVVNRLEYSVDLGDENKLYDELWTQIKAR